MQPLNVGLGNRSYPVYIGKGLLGDIDHWRRMSAQLKLPQRLLIVSDRNVANLYLQPLQHALKTFDSTTCVLEPGEANKNLAAMTTILDELIAGGFQRDAAVIALGGGVIGDIAGFAAACFMRGIRCVQIPTTLLAQVDSSVGGKTGVNHKLGKNLIGAFHQPVAVVIDTDTLATLELREVRAGLAEVIKYGCIYDADFFAWLETHMKELLALETTALARAIRRSCEIKATIVARDEKEAGERALLNFGHSFGHAIEQVTGYTRWLHGEAVAIGMLMACSLSHRMGLLSAAEVARVSALLGAAGLPACTDDAPVDALLQAMQLDKKNAAGKQRLILLNGIGASEIRSDCSSADIRQAILDYTGS
ncbi:MAG: 3-dehydroquinate synthase [Gammaproteobacteria bacterium]|nr:3-dehydroquinate synthase [Gammaproteobacteria bacterium]